MRVALGPDGLWLGVGGGLWSLDGDRWETVHPEADPGGDYPHTLLARGLDGTVWAFISDGAGDWSLVRIDEDGRTWYSRSAGVPMIGAPGGWAGRMAAGPDGKVWITPPDGGVSVFDGTTWTHFLGDTGLGQRIDLEVAPDGTVWVKGHRVYLIRSPSCPTVSAQGADARHDHGSRGLIEPSAPPACPIR
jgi:hypothetical protein